MQAKLTESQSDLNEIIKLWVKKDFINNQFSVVVQDNITYISIKNSLIRLPFPWQKFKDDFVSLVENDYLIKISNTIFECNHR
ncbi:MAG: hypothetical protein CVU41_08660 [Chloroflexi bacterium HGW-Chloroflexi-3]|nr:MAG: hypothetical protein CVU41_08660 [Chloroflexi bacterium HGW-Chloroflexi-3]